MTWAEKSNFTDRFLVPGYSNSWTLAILYGRNLMSWCEIRLTDRTDRCRRLHVVSSQSDEGDLIKVVLTASTILGVQPVRGLPILSLRFGWSRFNWNYPPDVELFCVPGTGPCRTRPSVARRARWVLTCDSPPFWKKNNYTTEYAYAHARPAADVGARA